MNTQPTEHDPKHDLVFRAWNSYWLEHISEAFNRRMDTIINALMLILGASVFANSVFSWLFGGIIAILSGCRIAWHFGQRAEAAKQQARRYCELLDNVHKLSVDEIAARLSMIEEFDSIVMECMDNPARSKACISMGLKHREHLNFPEKLIALLTVGIPR
ncbi:hypothetical protein PVO54_001731 [Enterobacter hormaechei]|uniref:hypothetical protein n=1 Tax=Enterobacter ludwigii TaxID=299767 RepID=UPI0027FBC3C7|nr:hypothetical protein [Escherichia coli]EKM8119060.1 hypothetical protein [Enterobacter hormaechei]EKY3905911.1 hypothetical protein [Enterobacter hormaechei]